MTWLGGWEGYVVAGIERIEGPVPEVWIFLSPSPVRAFLCDGCGQPVERLHDIEDRRVRDLPVLDACTWLQVPRRRVACPRCGPRLERLSWLERYARMTRRFAESVARLCQVLPIKHVAAFFRLSWTTVKDIDKSHLAETVGSVDLADVEIIAMDEFALHKGHRYATVIVEPRRKQVLWVGRGRSREDVRPFFDLLGEDGCTRPRAVAMDMNSAFAQEVKARCPQAAIVYDLFHVVAKYGREVLDRVRVDEANRLRGDKKARKVIKTARWLLLRNRDSIRSDEDRVKLEDLLQANQALMCAYVLKDDLKQLWRCESEESARTAWEAWSRRAEESGIKPLVAFARRLNP